MNFDHVQIQFGLEKNTFFHDTIQNIDEIQSLILSYIGHKYIGTDCPQPVKVKNQWSYYRNRIYELKSLMNFIWYRNF